TEERTTAGQQRATSCREPLEGMCGTKPGRLFSEYPVPSLHCGGLFARAALLGTNATVFMMRRMPHAFIITAAAHFCAKSEHRPSPVSAGAWRARSKKSSRIAHIRAVQIHADTLAQFIDRFFAETRIGTGDAHRSKLP